VPQEEPKEMTMDDTTTWKLIHAERVSTAGMLAALTPTQWSTPSLCAGWSVQITAGHILRAAEQTTGSFMKHMVLNGFRFNTMMDRDARTLGALPPAEIISRLQARTTTTNRPPAPVAAMLGEVAVHSEDIRRPLGLSHQADPAALVALLDMYKGATFPVAAKKRIGGLRLAATDIEWSHGDGPEVTGPAMSLVLAMCGRSAGLDDLDGPGLATLRGRVA
jgi:uncharacterized protein (TIGR03083 family)